MPSDITIIMSIIGLFLVLGTALPFINAEYGMDNNIVTTDIRGDITENVENDSSSISIFKVFISVLSMFFWTFGALPLVLDLFFVLLRITLVLAIARNVWIGGGS